MKSLELILRATPSPSHDVVFVSDCSEIGSKEHVRAFCAWKARVYCTAAEQMCCIGNCFKRGVVITRDARALRRGMENLFTVFCRAGISFGHYAKGGLGEMRICGHGVFDLQSKVRSVFYCPGVVDCNVPYRVYGPLTLFGT